MSNLYTENLPLFYVIPTPNKHDFNVLRSQLMIQILLEIYRHLSMGCDFG